jgi:glycine/D-amino acid oxidase-like deaminating enzyme
MSVLTPDFSTEPYWTEGLPPLRLFPAPSRSEADVAVIGGGLAGLSAALTLSRAGAAVVVLEAAAIGTGAAARSAGSPQPRAQGAPRGKSRFEAIGEAEEALDIIPFYAEEMRRSDGYTRRLDAVVINRWRR